MILIHITKIIISKILARFREVVFVLRSDLAHSEGVLVPGPPNVERIIAVVVSSLDSSGRDVTCGEIVVKHCSPLLYPEWGTLIGPDPSRFYAKGLGIL